MQSTSSLYSLSSRSPILLVRYYIQDCHVQKVTVRAGVLLSDATALSSPRWPDVLDERVLRMLISCPECHRIPLTRSVFMFGTIEDTPSIIRTGCKTSSLLHCISKAKFLRFYHLLIFNFLFRKHGPVSNCSGLVTNSYVIYQITILLDTVTYQSVTEQQNAEYLP